MPKISKEMGASYGPADAPVRTTDDPSIMAVARENEVVRERAESARLRKELSQLQREVDEGRISQGQQLEREQELRQQDEQRQREQSQREQGQQKRVIGEQRVTLAPGEQVSPGRTAEEQRCASAEAVHGAPDDGRTWTNATAKK